MFGIFLVSVCGCIAATILGFLVGIIRLSSNWLLVRVAYIYVEFTRNVPLLLKINYSTCPSNTRSFGPRVLMHMVMLARLVSSPKVVHRSTPGV